MAIYRLLQETAFKPDDVQCMETAYEQVIMLLGLKDRDDPITDSIAMLVIEIAQTGEKKPSTICGLVLRRLKGTDRELHKVEKEREQQQGIPHRR